MALQLAFETTSRAPDASGAAGTFPPASSAAVGTAPTSRSSFLGRRHADLSADVPTIVAGATGTGIAASGGAGTAGPAGPAETTVASYLHARRGGTHGSATVFLHPFGVIARLPAARGDLVTTRYGPGVVLAVRGGGGGGGAVVLEVAMLKWRLAGGALVKLFCQPEEVRALGNEDVKKVADSRCRVM